MKKLTLISFSVWAFLTPQVLYANTAGKAVPVPNAPKSKGPQTKPTKKLVIKDIKVPKEDPKSPLPEAKNGKAVTVHYTGYLNDGTKFDSSVDRGTPFTFNLGAGNVIPGWEKGVLGMKVGGKRNLLIPPQDGYGPNGFPPVIPPNATLNFDVELLDVK